MIHVVVGDPTGVCGNKTLDPVTVAIYTRAREQPFGKTEGWKLPGMKRMSKMQERIVRHATSVVRRWSPGRKDTGWTAPQDPPLGSTDEDKSEPSSQVRDVNRNLADVFLSMNREPESERPTGRIWSRNRKITILSHAKQHFLKAKLIA
jgi:hypothetical protein